MVKILVLGTSGMLGSMIFDYLRKNRDFSVHGTVRNQKYQTKNMLLFDAQHIKELDEKEILDLKFDYIINAIGITKPFCKDNDPEGVKRAIAINAKFPWELGDFGRKHGIKILTIGTDCVYSGKVGKYTEDMPHDPIDVYGKTKSLGEVFDGSTLTIRTSIIGPELKGETSFLLEWFLSQKEGGTIDGFEHHIWNGVTTLQFAKICEKIIESSSFDKLVQISRVHHFTPNSTVTKYELMQIFSTVFKKKIKINRVNKPEQKLDRSLSTKFHELQNLYPQQNMISAVEELRDYMVRSALWGKK